VKVPPVRLDMLAVQEVAEFEVHASFTA